MTLTHGLVKRRGRNCLGLRILQTHWWQHGCFNQGAVDSAHRQSSARSCYRSPRLAPLNNILLCECWQMAPQWLPRSHLAGPSWCDFPLFFPSKVLLLFGELALLTLSTWSCISAKWKNSIIFMPFFQTPREPTSPLWKCYVGKRQATVEITDGHRAQANEVNMMFFSRQQGHGKEKKKKKPKTTRNLIKVLNPRCIYGCRADFHANLETHASFTAQLQQNLINRILQGADFCQITRGLHSVSFPTFIDCICWLQNAFFTFPWNHTSQL